MAFETWTMNRAETCELSAAATNVHTVPTSVSFKKNTVSAMFSVVTTVAAQMNTMQWSPASCSHASLNASIPAIQKEQTNQIEKHCRSPVNLSFQTVRARK